MRSALTNPGLQAFALPAAHQAVAAIIRRHSSNTTDIREAALQGLDLTTFRQALDLGCGFGFMAETLAPRLAPDARLTGIDACEANGPPFIAHVGRAGRRGRFVACAVGETLPWADESFDLIVCSYSLYFFPATLPELARLLHPRGLLLVITHHRSSFVGLLRAVGLDPETSALTARGRQFPAEAAAGRLARYFAAVRQIDYPNRLCFHLADIDDLQAYVRFKLPLLIPGSDPTGKIPATIAEPLRAWLARHGELIIEKDDACFQCRRPRCP